MSYNYRYHLEKDIEHWLFEEIPFQTLVESCALPRFREECYDNLWIADDVTGNASGSYTISTYRAQENLCGNLDLLAEALADFGADTATYERALFDPEYADCTIRCWLLGECLERVLDRLATHFERIQEEP